MLLDRFSSKSILNRIKGSPRKLNLLAEQIRGKKIQHAMDVLTFSRKRVSKDVLKTLHSAVANAEHNQGLDIDQLVVSEAFVGKSITLRRFHARGRGRGNVIRKPYSNITIIVREQGV